MSSIFPLVDFPMFSAGTLAAIAQLFLVVITVRGTVRFVCQPGSTCWPSSDDWDSFNTSVGGSLAAVYPVATPCHNPSFDAAECAQVMMQYTNSTWRAEQIGTLSVREALTVAALQQINWETYPPLTESCYVDSGQTAPARKAMFQSMELLLNLLVRYPKPSSLRLRGICGSSSRIPAMTFSDGRLDMVRCVFGHINWTTSLSPRTIGLPAVPAKRW